MSAKEYLICKSDDVNQLANVVDMYMTKGWKPTGGICAVNTGYGAIEFYQAMVNHVIPESGD